MKTRVLVSLILAGLVGSTTAARPIAPQSEFVVIVNRANPVTALAASEVEKIFLKKADLWPDGTPVDDEVLARLHREAAEHCFIMRSVNFSVRVQPTPLVRS